jgi:tellurite resistance protein TerC
MGKPVWVWLTFIGIVIALLVFRPGRPAQDRPRDRRSGEPAAVGRLHHAWRCSSAAGSGGTWARKAAWITYTGFVVEKSLAMDNVFVIALIFSYFAIPRQYQHRVLFWGILGVIVLRAIMIGLARRWSAEFGWVLYMFAAFLIFTGIKMLWIGLQTTCPTSRTTRAALPEAAHARDRGAARQPFFVREPDPKTGKRMRFATPLFLALVLVEFADLVFAVDSVPAIFAITTDPFIVYTPTSSPSSACAPCTSRWRR